MRLHRRPLPLLVLSLLTIFPFAHAFAGPPAHLWAKRGGSSGGNDIGRGVATRSGGTVFVGNFTGAADFAGSLLSSNGGTDAYVCWLDPNTGTVSMLFGVGGTGTDAAMAVAIDASGAYYIAGFFSGTIDFGLGVTLTSAGSTDAFVAKYAGSNQILWARQFGGTGVDSGESVAVDPMGNVYMTGYFNGTASILGHNLVSNGNTDIFLLKLDSSGNWVNNVGFGSAGFDSGHDVLVDGANNVVLAADFTNTVNFGGGNLVSAGTNDMIFAKYNSSLVHVWSQRFGSLSADAANSVAANSANEIYLAGIFNGPVDFGGGVLNSAGGYDVVVAKFASTGTHIWSRRFGGMNSDAAYSLALDAASNVFVTGSMGSPVDFGGGVLSQLGGDDVYIASYSPAGVHRWSQSAGNTSFDYGNGIATDMAGNVYATGQFNIAVQFGTGLVSSGADDVYMVKLSGPAAAPDITSITDVPNDQGRRVKIRFERSGFDQTPTTTTILSYEAYRKDAAGPSLTVARDPATLSPRELLADGWSFVGSAPAHTELTYGFDVPTIGDSTSALGSYFSTFYIRAATGTPATFFDSPVDSGYSLDNLAPGIPYSFIYTAGDLSWDESEAEDFDYFTVYGANTDAFGSAVVVDHTVSPAMDVSASPYVYYYVTATDFSGNEGKPAKVNTLSGADGTPESYVLSVSSYPNPFNPRTTVSYTVPSRGRVRVAVYDVRGSLVTTLVDREHAAGAYNVEWDGLAAGSALGSGVYFARIEHNGATRSKKLVLLK